MALSPAAREKLSGVVFNEPLSAETEKKRRNLLFTACFSILLSVYGLEVTRTPWLEFEVPAGAPNILHGALSAALAYTLIVFIFHASADIRRWLAAGDLLRLSSYYDLSLKVHNHLNRISQWLDKPSPADPEKLASVRKMRAESADFLSGLDNTIIKANASHRSLTMLRWTRVIGFDIGVPVLLGFFALIKIGPALPPFLSVVLG